MNTCNTGLEVAVAVIPYPKDELNPWGDFGWLVRLAFRPEGSGVEPPKTDPVYGAVCRHTGGLAVFSEEEFNKRVVSAVTAGAQHLVCQRLVV